MKHPQKKNHTLHLLTLASMLLLLTTLYYREKAIEEAGVRLQRFSHAQISSGGSDLCVAGSWAGSLSANINSFGQTTGWNCFFDSSRYCKAGPDGLWKNCSYPPSFRHPWPRPVSP